MTALFYKTIKDKTWYDLNLHILTKHNEFEMEMTAKRNS